MNDGTDKNISSLRKSFFRLSADSALGEHETFYRENVERWLHNAIDLKYQYPLEIAVYVADLLNSNFTLSFIVKNAFINFKDVNQWGIGRKVQFINSFFENGYNYFGLLIHAHNYHKEYISTLEPVWYSPIQVNEYNKKKYLRGKDYKGYKKVGQYVTKQWVLQNNPFLKTLSEDEVQFINSFRNSDSHDATQIHENKVFEIADGKVIDRTVIVESLCRKLVSIYTLSLHFHLILLLEGNFWIAGYLVLKSDLVKYNKANIDFTTYTSNFDKDKSGDLHLKNKPALSNLINFITTTDKQLMKLSIDKLKKARQDLSVSEIHNKARDNTMEVYQLLSEYSLDGFWKRVRAELHYYNRILEKFDYFIDVEELDNAENEASNETLCMTQVSIYHMVTSIEGHESMDLFKEFIATKGESGITKEIASKLLELGDLSDKKFAATVKAFSLISLGFAILSGVGMFQKNLDVIVKKNM